MHYSPGHKIYGYCQADLVTTHEAGTCSLWAVLFSGNASSHFETHALAPHTSLLPYPCAYLRVAEGEFLEYAKHFSCITSKRPYNNPTR